VATELAKLRTEVDASVVKQRRLAEQAAALPAVATVGLSPAIRRRAHGAAAELVSGGCGAGGGGAGGGGAGGGDAGGGAGCPPLSGNAIFYHVGARAPSEHVCIAETFYDIFVRFSQLISKLIDAIDETSFGTAAAAPPPHGRRRRRSHEGGADALAGETTEAFAVCLRSHSPGDLSGVLGGGEEDSQRVRCGGQQRVRSRSEAAS
jgi:hypothetical protein